MQRPTAWALHPPIPTVRLGLRAPLKRGLDVCGALALGVLCLPLLVLTMGAIRWLDGGPVFYGAERVGEGGRPFTMWKLRTMAVDADDRRHSLAPRNERDGPLFKLRADPRITPLGAWLRRWSIDELPQLWNVLRGEMSLVGPRPVLLHELDGFPEAARRRWSVPPGLSGPAQVSGRADLPFEAMLRCDLAYVDGWTLRADVWCLLRTVPAVWTGRGAW